MRAAATVPRAEIRRSRSAAIWLVWLVPLAAMVLVGWLVLRTVAMRGERIIVRLDEGHDLRAGDEVRFRGVTVGEVRQVGLAEGLDSVVVEIGLRPEAADLARRGSQFWVVRPQVSFSGVAGLETLVGPRYMAALPGPEGGVKQYEFMGLREPPVVERIEVGDLEVLLQSTQRGSLRPGAAVTYRQVKVGSVVSVGLTSDGGTVEARVHIQKAYAQLVRQHTRFWDAGKAKASLGITGLKFEVDSVETLLTGGVALATPPESAAGAAVANGHRFVMAEAPEAAWLNWQPMVAIGSDYLPAGAVMPEPLRARLGWRQGMVFRGNRSRQGWVLQTAEGLLGPADLLTMDRKARDDSTTLEVAGVVHRLGSAADQTQATVRGLLAVLPVNVSQRQWPAERMRKAEHAEDALIVGDPGSAPLPLAASRMTAESANVWLVDKTVSLESSWHGAAVLSRTDGQLIGILVIDDDEVARIVSIPPPSE